MSRIASLVLMTSVTLVSGCVTMPAADPVPLQVQAYQVKEFETTKTTALACVINVFQDLGYIIQSADRDTGFVTAVSPAKNSGSLLDALAGYSNTGTTKATAFIEELRPNFTTVRLTFVVNEHTTNDKGQDYQRDTVVADPKIFQNAFNKIDDALFIRGGTRPAAKQSSPAAK
jgi:hypothetical protein